MGAVDDAYFAGRVFACGEQDGYRFYLWGEVPVRPIDGNRLSFTSTYAEPADGAFLCKLETGWLFVTGTKTNIPFRHTFLDNTPDAESNAHAMQALGCEVLTLDEANARVRADGVQLHSITAEEKRRTDALSRHAKNAK